ncbi:hypothetical protein M9Y10_040238 [Tritrichomonas musculus]|uniref:Protein kinase domain-containing protein n=1 Tax=Tritrichomonas musculus TaxID=1915356 RepID=A0ABR2GR30_9EUKA
MKQSILDFQDMLKKKKINTTNKYLNEILCKFDFIFYPEYQKNEKGLKQLENNSKIIVIDERVESDIEYYVACIEYKLIIIPKEDTTDISILRTVFANYDDFDKYFIQDNSNQYEIYREEIRNFSEKFRITNKNFQRFWSIVVNCLSGFLIKKGYKNSRNMHDKYLNEEFSEHQESANFANSSYIELRTLGRGSGGTVKLIYYILKEELYALKLPNVENVQLNQRERNNYLNIRHTFIVHYIGYIKYSNDTKFLILEYVEGETLNKYRLEDLNYQGKCIIIFDLLLAIHYLHSQKYIYRDLSLRNVIINQNKDAILIDFDHVRKENDETENEERTENFYGPEVAPEVRKTYQSDIYSLGYIIHFILYGKAPEINNKMETNEDFLLMSCLDHDPSKRPNLNKIMEVFCIKIFATFKFTGRKEQRLIWLAANQRIPQAQFYLAQDTSKAIHYFSLAANQNMPEAQFNLGVIYYDGQYIKRDINKAIHYYSLAANQNHPQAQFNLGFIYNDGQYIKRDINKAIHYFQLAANLNDPEAQYSLGYIYYSGECIKQNIKKGTYYIMLASINKHRQANFGHGFLLHEGKYVKKDILEAIHYYKEASSFNNQYSKNNLGIIYKHGYDKIEKKLGMAIEYFEEAIRQKNDYLSMYNLAHIYMYDASVEPDLKKAIDLLIRSLKRFKHSFILLCAALLLQYKFNIETIKQELNKRTDIDDISIKILLRSIASIQTQKILSYRCI